MRVTVIGAGVVGLATADALRRRDVEVRVLEPSTPMGARSLGGSRIFRLAHGDASLVDAAARSRPLWRNWERRAGRTLVGSEGTVVVGGRVTAWADAMLAADVGHRVGTDPGTLPGPLDGPVLFDPAGGVIDVHGVGELLTGATETATVTEVHPDGTVVTPDGAQQADAVVVAAGAGTAPLMTALGVDVPDRLNHHVRFSFALRGELRGELRGDLRGDLRGGSPPCLLNGIPYGDLESTYQHRTHDGHWAVGGHLPDDQCQADDPEGATQRWRQVIGAYVAEHLPGVDPEVVEEIACTPTAGLGDGVHTARVGAVHAVWGENLFKLAPLLGEHLADAVQGDDVAHAI